MRALSLCLVSLFALSCTSRYARPARCVTPATDASPARVTLVDSDVIPVSGAPMLGPRDAPVTVVVFSDFQCPYCNRGRAVVADLRTMFPDAVRVVWRNLPLARHPDARPAAEAALEAWEQGGDALFWRFHDILFAHQNHLARADLERYAEHAGLDLVRFRRALDEGTHASAIDADLALAERLHVDGTPAFFVNGTPIVGARPLEEFEEVARGIFERAARSPIAPTFYADMVREPLPAPERPGRGARRGGDDWATVHALDVPPGAPSRGAADAPIVVQVFSDFQCPYCAQVEPTLESLRAHYRERLRIVWRDFPLPRHPDAMPAAEAAREALAQRGDEGFWRYHDAIFAHASDEDGLARAALERLARAQGLDLARFRQALDDHRHVAAIRADMAAATATGARLATPAFFINGHFMSGAQPLTEFIARIDGLAR